MDKNSLSVYKFNIKFETCEEMSLPLFKGSMFRGVFGIIFREIVCITNLKECNECNVKEHCSYFKVFETEFEFDKIFFLQGVKKVPHPFIIAPGKNCDKNNYTKGEILEINFTVFADIVKLLPFFVYTFIEITKRGIGYKRNKIFLKEFNFINREGIIEKVLTENNKLIIPTEPTHIIEKPEKDENPPSEIKLILNTPLRIQNKGKVLSNKNDITAEVLVRAFYRRYYSIFSIYTGMKNEDFIKPEINFDEITIDENNLKFADIKRYSSRQKTKMEFGGFTGSITLSGKLNEIYPVIKLIEKINLGKNTAFGYGEFTVG